MDKRFIAVLIFAFTVATVSSFAMYRLISNQTQPARAAPQTKKVVIATRNLELGTTIKDGDLALTDWLGEKPAGASSDMDDFVGRGVITKIYAREVILDDRLALKGAGGGLAAMIPPGMRAVAVPVNQVVDVAGFAVAGMHVDVLISGTPPSGTGGLGTETKTLLQDIDVLSAGQDFKKDAEGKPVTAQVVNLLVTPEQAEKLSLASHQTTIQLVLRNPLDRDVAKTQGVALEQLFVEDQPKPEAAAPPRARLRRPRMAKPSVAVAPPSPVPPSVEEPPVMEIILGTKKIENTFQTK